MFLSLTIICVVAGAILAGVNMYTTGPIAATKAAALEAVLRKAAHPPRQRRVHPRQILPAAPPAEHTLEDLN